MKHQDPRIIVSNAQAVASVDAPAEMTRSERLERWASLLDRHDEPINALRRIEYMSAYERRALRGDQTPLSVAFADPVLREEGLESDRLGDVMDFFQLTDADAHRLLCDCHYHGAMTGEGLAKRLRHHIARSERPSLWSRVQDFVAGRLLHA
ncbi:hypothetical protein [Aquamicrobium sp. LC103]|uniref:hypothetical protein n=1 Tax=Aquamicrobium sp. LC103 TaxID=1120658 RepID=UPI0010C97344|nr:hypothetical protein [Aquamicrobium sp. LC103]TKT74670.1 hypothetical protein XW59_022340 [Aquamicrobium sp. LC103]